MKETLRRFSDWVWDWLAILSPLLVLAMVGLMIALLIAALLRLR